MMDNGNGQRPEISALRRIAAEMMARMLAILPPGAFQLYAAARSSLWPLHLTNVAPRSRFTQGNAHAPPATSANTNKRGHTGRSSVTMGPGKSAVKRSRKSCEGARVKRGADLDDAASDISVEEELFISSSRVTASGMGERERLAGKEERVAATAGGVGRGRRSGVVGACSRCPLAALVSLKREAMFWGRFLLLSARSSSLRICDVAGCPLAGIRKYLVAGPARFSRTDSI